MKEIEVAGPRAVFFQIGKSKIDDYGMVNIQLAAKILKANPDKKYKIAGYADKATGSAKWNQKLSCNFRIIGFRFPIGRESFWLYTLKSASLRRTLFYSSAITVIRSF